MKDSNRYKTSHLLEDQFEPGSGKKVLKNLRHLTAKSAIDEAETETQLLALNKFAANYGQDHCFTAKDICQMHKTWLGSIYGWAGQYRSVNISKGGFSFAAAREIPKLMNELEINVLLKYTPCRFKSLSRVAEALGRAMAVWPACFPS